MSGCYVEEDEFDRFSISSYARPTISTQHSYSSFNQSIPTFSQDNPWDLPNMYEPEPRPPSSMKRVWQSSQSNNVPNQSNYARPFNNLNSKATSASTLVNQTNHVGAVRNMSDQINSNNNLANHQRYSGSHNNLPSADAMITEPERRSSRKSKNNEDRGSCLLFTFWFNLNRLGDRQ